jgi:hypothetical protein
MNLNKQNSYRVASRRSSFAKNCARFAVAFVMFVVSFASGIVLSNAAGAVESSPQTTVAFLDLSGQITNSVVLQPQVTANVLVRVANSGATATSSSSAPSLTINVPAGVIILGVDSINPGPSSSNTVTGTWTCSEVTATSKRCLLTNSGQPQILDALTQTLASIRLDSSNSGKVTGAKIEATAVLAGAGAVTASASLDIESPQVGLALNIIGQSQVQSGQATQITYQLTNRGLVAASSYTGSKGVVPTATLSNLLPARRFTSWTSTSTGWTCVGDPLEAPTCSMTDATLAPDASAPPLTIQFVLAQGRALTTPDASPSAAIKWPVVIAEAANGAVLTSTQNMELYVGPRSVGKLSVHLRAVTSSMLSPGQSVNFSVKHLAIDGFARGIVDTLTIPSGLTTSAVDSGGWKCPAGSGRVKCTFAGVVARGGDPSYVITLNAASSASSATGLLRVASSGNDGEATAQDAQPIFVINIGGARLELQRILGSTSLKKVTDGTPLTLTPGTPSDASFVLVNTGNKPLAAGAVITVTASLSTAAIAYLQLPGLSDPEQIKLTLPPAPSGGPVCTADFANFKATCILTLQAPLDVSNDSPAFSFLLNLKSAIDNNFLPILPTEMKTLLSQGNLMTLTASVANNSYEIAPINYTPQISIITPNIKLRPILTSPSLKLGDTPATVKFQMSNYGDAVGQSITIFPVPNSLRATSVEGSGCVVTGSTSQIITCTVPALAAGTQLAPTLSNTSSFQLSNVSASYNASINASVTANGTTYVVPVVIPVAAVSLTNTHFAAPDPATNISAVTLGMTQATVSWTAPSQVGAGLNDYTVSCTPSCVITSQPRAGDTSLIITGLTKGTSYTFSVITNALDNQQSTAVTSSPVSTSSTPGLVISPQIMNLTSTSATVSWQAPAGSGTAITSYYVCRGVPGSVACTTTLSTGSSTTRNLTGLSRSTSYSIYIVAYAGSSTTESTLTFSTPSITPALFSSSSAMTAHAMQPRAATTTVPPTTGANFNKICADVAASLGSQQTSLSESLGGQISASLTGISINGSCSSGSVTISFTGGSLNLYGVYSVSIGAGTITSTGITINSASLTTPSGWSGGAITLASTSPVTLPFSGTASAASSSVSVQGTFSASGLFGLPLPSGWTANTSFTFSYTNSVVGIAVSSTAGPSGSGLTISGSANTNGDYSVSVTGNLSLGGATISGVSASWASGSPFTFAGTVSIGGTTLSVSGSYTNTSTWTFSANGTLTLFGTSVAASGSIISTNGTVSGSYTMTMGTVTVVSGMTVNSLTMSWSPSAGLTGTGTLTIAGTAVNLTTSYTNSNNWTFTVSGNVSLFGASIAATGTVTKSNGTTTGSYTMTVGDLSLVSGISASGLVMTWSTGNGLTGSGTINFSDFAVAFSVQYTDSSNWTLNATSNGSGSIAIIPGVTVSGASFTGTVTKVSGTVSLNLSVSFSSLTLISNLVSLQNATFSISNSCPTTFTSTLCPSGNTSYLSATGTLQMNLGTGLGTQNVAMSAVYGIQSKGFELSAGFSDITVVSGLLKVTSPTISMSYGRSKTVSTGTITGIGDGTKNGYTLSISGDVALSMPGFSQSISVKLTYGTSAVGGYNFVLNGDLVDAGTIGETGAVVADLVYSSAAMSLSLNGLQVTVPANTLVLGGKFVLPDWLAKYLGHTVESVALYATYTNPTSYSVTGAFQLNLPIPTGSSSFKFSITSFSVSLTQSVLGYTQSLNATGTFTVSGSAGNAVIDITLGLSYQDSTATITGSITASASSGYLWSDAFGMPGVQLQAFAIQVGIELATSPIPLPSLGLAANIVINGTTAQVLGITDGTPIFALVNISATNPAMVIKIGVQGGPTAINLANVLTATYAELYLAPDGCTVGTYVIQPGFSFYFDGTILGVPLTVQAKITISGNNVNLDASVAVGAFNVTNSINFDGAVWTIAINKDSAAFGFSGSGTIFGVSVLFSGETKYDLTTGTVLASYKGSVSDFNLYGFSLKNVSLTMDTVWDPQNKSASISISGTGSMTILGAELKIEQMVFSWQNGVFKTLAVQVSANIVVTNSISLVGDFFLNADLATQQFKLSATGKIVMGAFSLDIATCPNGQPGLSISTSGFNLCAATLDVGFARATINGVMYFSAPSAGTYIGNSAGNSVQAQAGDFNFGASNVTVDICGFATATGYLQLGNVGGTFFAKVSAGIGLSNTSSDQLVQISGSFDSAGNFTLTGTGQVKLAAINFNLNVTASSQGGQVSVSAGTNLSIAGSTFALTGTFAKVSGGVKITMSVMANLTISGFDLGQATVTVFVEPLTEYVSISSALSLGGIFNANLSGNLGAVNGQALFNFTVSTGINIPGVAVSGNLTLTNCGDSSCTSTGTFRASVSGQFLDFYGVSYSFSSVNVNSDWSFTSTSSGSVSTCSDWTSFGVVQFSACVGGSYSVTLSTASPYVAFNLGFDVNVSRQIWTVTITCSGKWYNPRSWNCDVNAGWGPTRDFVSISGTVDSDGNVRASFNGITWRFKI